MLFVREMIRSPVRISITAKSGSKTSCACRPPALESTCSALPLCPIDKIGTRCSDKGFLPMSLGDYLQLLDWTGRQLAQGKTGRIPDTVGPILERLQLDQKGWCELVAHFGRRFFVVAGAPTTIDGTTNRVNQHRYHVPAATRQLCSYLYRVVESRKAPTE